MKKYSLEDIDKMRQRLLEATEKSDEVQYICPLCEHIGKAEKCYCDWEDYK